MRKFDSRAVPLGSFIQDEIRLTKFLTSSRGLLFIAKQLAMQVYNPTLETRIYNPLSILTSAAPYVNTQRHLSLGGALGIGISVPFSVGKYEDSLRIIPDRNVGSRIAFQSPRFSDEQTERPGLKYADYGRNWMADKSKLKLHDPNRFGSPIFGDIGPLSSFLPGGASLDSRSYLADLAVKYTKSTGFTPATNLETSFISNIVPGVLKNFVPSSVIKYVSQILGFHGLDDIFKGSIRIYNNYNSTYRYAPGILHTGNQNVQFKIVNSDGTSGTVYGGGNTESPLFDILNTFNNSAVKSAVIGEIPFTFKRSENLINDIGDSVDERTKYSPQDGNRQIISIPGYSDLVSRRKSKEYGNIDNTSGIVDIGDKSLHYEAEVEKLENDGLTKTVYRTYGFADPGRKIDRDKFRDKINMLRPNEDYVPGKLEDIIPFKFHNLTTNQFLIFRATLTGINENINAEFNSKRYIGRTERVYTYVGADRKLSFNFTVFPYSAAELEPLWLKLNKLVGYCYPVYRSIGNVGQYMIPPFTSITIGDMYSEVPGILESISITVDDETTWEIRDSESALSFNQKEIFNIAKLPRLIRIAISFAIINKTLPSANSAFYDAEFIKNSIAAG